MKKQIVFFSLLILGMNLLAAAGIGTIYWEDNPLQMGYGESEVVELNLQNAVGEEDLTMTLNVKSGNDIAKLEKATYVVPAGSSDVRVPLTISVPENYPRESQKIEIEAVSASEEVGMVTLGTGWSVSFDVVLSESLEQAKRKSSWGVIFVIFISLLIVAIASILFKKYHSE